MDKIFNNANYETKDNGHIYYSTPKAFAEGVLKSYVKYLEDGEKFNLCFETDVFVLHTGIQKSSNNIHYLDLEFNETNEALHEFIGELDELGMGKTWEKSKIWFGTQMDQDLIDSFYKFPLRTNKRGNMPYLRLKLDMNNLVVKNQYGAKLNLETISSESKVKVKIRYDGLLFYKQLFTPVYYVYEIKYYQQRNKVGDGFSFYTYDNDLPEMVVEDGDRGFETEAEELYDFDKKNEEDIQKMLKINEYSSETTSENKEDQLDNNKTEDIENNLGSDVAEDVESNGEDKLEDNAAEDRKEQLEENAADDGEEQLEENATEEQLDDDDRKEQLEENDGEEQLEENAADDGEEKVGSDGDEILSFVEVEDVEVKDEEEVEERKEEEISEIISKNLTKVLEKDEETLAIYEDDPLEEQENKLREMLRRVEKAKATYTGTSVSETSSGSRRGKKKRILRYSKTRVVNQQL
jgi:hypothetical protein